MRRQNCLDTNLDSGLRRECAHSSHCLRRGERVRSIKPSVLTELWTLRPRKTNMPMV
jgi:hypothetical protein